MTPISRTRVKICGITRPEDGVTAAELGADAIGLVFYPPSPRFVDVETAQRIVAALPPFVATVGLFVNAEPAAVRAVLAEVSLALLQFHGDEEPDDCAGFGLPYIKAVPMGAGADVLGLRTTVRHGGGPVAGQSRRRQEGRFRPGLRLDPDSRRTPQAADPGRWAASRQRRRRDPPGPALRGGCQQRRGNGQGHQGRRIDARIFARCV